MTEDLLAALGEPPAAANWPDPAVVRGRAERQRRRRRGTEIAAVAIVLIIAVALLVPRSGGDARPATASGQPGGVAVAEQQGIAAELVSVKRAAAPRVPTSAVAEAAVGLASQTLAVKLLRELNRRSPDSANLVVSPASLAIALSMLDLGARGRTEQEIATLIGPHSAAGWGTLTAEWAAQHDVTLETANNLWQQAGMVLRAQFLDDLARNFDTGVWQVDFARHPEAAADAINKWADAKTHGKITKIVTAEQVRTWVLALANALYFKAAWARPFDSTAAGSFNGPNGRVDAKIMSLGGPFSAARTTAYQAVQLPYAGGRFAALAIMPTTGGLSDFVSSLDLSAVTTSLKTTAVKVELPQFTIDGDTIELTAALKALGMVSAFGDADLSGIAGKPGDLFVDTVLQRAYLSVGQKGTEAAAVTVIGVVPKSAHLDPEPVYRFDRPFVFLIRDTVSGAVLFAAQVQNPS